MVSGRFSQQVWLSLSAHTNSSSPLWSSFCAACYDRRLLFVFLCALPALLLVLNAMFPSRYVVAGAKFAVNSGLPLCWAVSRVVSCDVLVPCPRAAGCLTPLHPLNMVITRCTPTVWRKRLYVGSDCLASPGGVMFTWDGAVTGPATVHGRSISRSWSTKRYGFRCTSLSLSWLHAFLPQRIETAVCLAFSTAMAAQKQQSTSVVLFFTVVVAETSQISLKQVLCGQFASQPCQRRVLLVKPRARSYERVLEYGQGIFGSCTIPPSAAGRRNHRNSNFGSWRSSVGCEW
jgi:hypothetical protein